MLNKASTSKASKRGAPNKEWITKEQFYDVYPKGYRECNFFSTPIECWAMSKEACRKRPRTALLDLSWYLNAQRNLQQTSFIGHSLDTELLTELLRNNKNSIYDNVNNNAQTQNTNNPINNNVNMPTNILIMKIANSNNCYTCNNICKCSRLLPTKPRGTKNETVAFLSQARLALPEIDLIDKLDTVSIKSSIGETNLISSGNILDLSVTNNSRPNISDYSCDTLKIDSHSVNRETLYESDDLLLFHMDTLDQLNSTNQLDNNVIVTQMITEQIVHDESITNENDEYDEIILKYFNLISISDIFQDLQEA